MPDLWPDSLFECVGINIIIIIIKRLYQHAICQTNAIAMQAMNRGRGKTCSQLDLEIIVSHSQNSYKPSFPLII